MAAPFPFHVDEASAGIVLSERNAPYPLILNFKDIENRFSPICEGFHQLVAHQGETGVTGN